MFLPAGGSTEATSESENKIQIAEREMGKKFQAEQPCEKMSICSTRLEKVQSKQVKIKPRKDSRSVCLKIQQTLDYLVTISKA